MAKKRKCIIKLFDNWYDITEFIELHPGGNVFECGKDNTEVFLNHHAASKDEKLKLLEKYKISEDEAKKLLKDSSYKQLDQDT